MTFFFDDNELKNIIGVLLQMLERKLISITGGLLLVVQSSSEEMALVATIIDYPACYCGDAR